MSTEKTNGNNAERRAQPVNTRPSLGMSILMVLVILIGVNVISGVMRMRADLTEENLHTLTDGTKSILDKLEDELVLRYYFSKGLGNVPRQYMAFKTFGTKVQELLEEYDNYSSNVRLEIIDPEPDTEVEEDATKYGIQGLPIEQTGAKFYMGMVALYGGNEKVIPIFDPTRVEYLEYDLSRTLDEVRQKSLPKVGVISTLPVQEVQGFPGMTMPGMPQPQEGWFFMKELSKTYKVETVETTAEKLPDGISLLMVMHPKNLPEKLLWAIDQYVLKGGRAIVLVDPYCRSDNSPPPPGGNPMMQGQDKSSDLNRLLAKWGVEVPADKIAASQKYPSTVAAGPQGQVNLPTWIWFRGSADPMNKESVIAGKLEDLRFIEPGFINKKTVDGVEVVPLVKDPGPTGEMGTFDLQFTYVENSQKVVYKEGEKLIAALLKGKFKSAFEKPPEGVDGKDHVKESAAENSIVVIADTDFIADDYWVNQMNIFGHVLARPLNDNFNLLANAIEFLSGSQDLINIRSRGKFERPFTRVQKMKREAEERWKSEEQRLMAKLQETEQKLAQLSGAEVKDGRIILTSEQEEQLKTFREEQVKTRTELRRVRRDLRRDVDSMGKWITFLNIGVIPILVAIFGIFFISSRRR